MIKQNVSPDCVSEREDSELFVISPRPHTRCPGEKTCLLVAGLAGSRFILGEADVMLSGLKGLQPSLHVLLEDFLVLSFLGILGDEVAAAASFVLAMTARPCHEAGRLGLPRGSQDTTPTCSSRVLPAQLFHN